MKFAVLLLLMSALCMADSKPVQAQETALASLREAAKRSPTDLAAQRALGEALIEAGRLTEAATQMSIAVRLSKGSIESLYDARRVDFASGDYKKARLGCRELSAKNEKHVLAQVCMARAFLAWRRASQAVEYIDKALAIDPANYEALLAHADATRMQGDLAGAAAAYERALAQKPGAADAELGLGQALGLAKQNDKAMAALRSALAAAPNDPDVQLELGRHLTGTEAVELLQKAVAGRPHWPEAELELAGAQLRAGNAGAADPLLLGILKQTPEHPLATAGHGAALVALGHYEDAEPVLKRALTLLPNDYESSLALAQVYEHTGRGEEAFTQYRAASDLKREDPAALIAAARLGLKLQRALLAGALLDKALERAPRSAAALALSGEVALQRGDKKAARDFFVRALQGEGAFDRAAVLKRLDELK